MSSSMQPSHLPATTESIAKAQEAKDASESISILYQVLEDPSTSADALRTKELAITNLTNYLTKENRAEDLRGLLTKLRPFFVLIPKAKTAKIVRSIIDAVAKIPGTSELQISLCKEMVEWTRAEKRTFLRQRVEARLAALLLENQEYTEALNLLSGLIKEVRRLDDKLLLVDIDLLESKLHFSLRNLPKAKASLTAARTAANAIYVPPSQQGTIDLQSGILHAEEKDYKTGYSYFFEAFEAFSSLEDPRAISSLKYMLLCKIMVSQADDVAGIISSKVGLKYLGPDVDAMKAVADAYSKRSLKYFETALRDYKSQLEEDPIVHRHLSSLYDTLLEQNLCRLIEPYSRVEIAHIAEMIELPIDHVEKKLSQMILDKKFAGTLDQGAGCLIIFEDPKTEEIFPATLETIGNVGKVVDSLYMRSAKIMGGAALPALSPLSETLWRDRAAGNGLLLGDVSARLAWRDLTVTVALGSGDTQAVLQGLTGHAEPGTITALMGPSGSGKSTLLDALAGRLAANAFLTGTVLLNGRKANLSFGAAAYVTQDDNLIGTLTVRETISYSACLRLPDKMLREEKQALVEGTIVEMGLQDCADTVVGNWHLRGISGGEKRRVSIALEILMRPRLLFLDEPTSGLDSASAFFVTQMLRRLARDGRTVIASVHQPSSEVFQLFDSLYLLSGGKTVYFGMASEACQFFAQAGFPCPPLRNPSDHFLRCVNSDFDKVKATLKGSMKTRFERTDDPLERTTTSEVMRRLISYYQHSQYYFNAQQKVDEMARVKGTVLNAGGSQASFGMQAYTLTKRSFINMSRDFGYYWLRLIIYIVVTLCIGTIYLNVGTGYNSILARGACASFIFGFVTFMSIGGFPSFVEDMKVFQRERLNGHYGVLAFVISNTLSAMPFLFLITFVSGTMCYFMVRLHPGFMHYLFFVLCLYASVTVVESLMMAIASVIPNFLMGIIIGAGIQGIFMLVSGYFRLPHDIPKPFWRYPMSYISFHYWALQGQYQNDLKGLVFDNQDDELPKIPGEYILENVFQMDVNRSKWLDLAVLLSMIIIYRLLFFIMIKVSEDVTPWVRGYIARRRAQNRRQRKAELAAFRSPSLRGYVVDAASLPADHP